MSENFLVLPGPAALSAFRVNYLIQDLEKKLDCAGAIAGVASSYTHYVSLKQNL
ncbi:hypothetical protein OXX79_013977, partial [Metschnikowia pulcherrima]